MSNPIIKVKRATSEAGRFAVSTGAPSTLNHGEIAVIFPDAASATPSSLGETIYVGAADGSAVAVGGSGTFATRQYVDDKVTSVFVYKGKISSFFGASPAFPLNLDSTLSQVTGSYYSIDSDYPGNPDNDDPGTIGTDKNAVSIAWTEGGAAKSLLVKLGDSIVKTATGWEKFDNVDAVVHGTATETAVTGDENTGYTVGLATEFKNRVSDLEDKTQNIDSANTSPGLTTLKGKFVIDQSAVEEPELVVKDLYGGELVNVKGAAISLGSINNPGTEVKIARKLVMQDPTNPSNASWEFKADGSAKNYATQGAALGASFEVDASGNVALGTPYGGEVKVQSDFKAIGTGNATNFSVTKSGLIKLNEATNNATVESYGTLDINAGGGLSDGGWVGLRSNGHLVADGSNLEIRGFVIDGGDF